MSCCYCRSENYNQGSEHLGTILAPYLHAFFFQEHDKDAYSCCDLNEYCCPNQEVTRDGDRKCKGNDKTGNKSLTVKATWLEANRGVWSSVVNTQKSLVVILFFNMLVHVICAVISSCDERSPETLSYNRKGGDK